MSYSVSVLSVYGSADPLSSHLRLTRDATLAELTSLEQLLGVMMSKGVVEDDVIAKLWQVYSEFTFLPPSACYSC